ncbi:helix-turn-helix domain-containing protein [Lactococcus petauri]|uniref:helix-turn-helix domain-containing protein n=1 Tax=Lactococcus petauri TaxID=1940789 RepID=UPI001F5691EF|nr:helix-turn-helix domain-containing protein [Lactococcus petauri]
MTLISRYTLKDLRKINHLSIEQLSEKTGVVVETLVTVETDSSNISFEVLKKLSRFYCIAANYIFLGKPSEFDTQLIDETIKLQQVKRSNMNLLSSDDITTLAQALNIAPKQLLRIALELITSKEGEENHE